MEPGAIVLFILVAIALRALDARRKQGKLPPVIQPGWPPPKPAPPRTPEPHPASKIPVESQASSHVPVESRAPRAPVHYPAPIERHADPPGEAIVGRASHSHSMTRTGAEQPLQVHSPLAMAPLSPHVLVAPPGSALAQLQDNIEKRRLALEARMLRGGAPSERSR